MRRETIEHAESVTMSVQQANGLLTSRALAHCSLNTFVAVSPMIRFGPMGMGRYTTELVIVIQRHRVHRVAAEHGGCLDSATVPSGCECRSDYQEGDA